MEAPKFLLQKRFLLRSIIFVLAFSVLFLLLYDPFSPTVWFAFTPVRNFLLAVLFYALALIYMIASKYVLYHIQKHHALSLEQYVAWMLLECLFIGVIYLVLTRIFFSELVPFTFALAARTAACVGVVLAIPYALYMLYAFYISKCEEVDMLKMALESRREQQSSDSIINLKDYQGNNKVSIEKDFIYYMVSQDNYVQIFYDLDGKMQSYMLRCKTQDLEQQFAGTSLVRCHRSYIVNIHKAAFFKHDKARAFITLSDPGATEIPVSKSYYSVISGLLSERG